MMDRDALISAMRTSISEVLETMFFLPLEFAQHRDPGELWTPEDEGVLVIRLDFNGPFSGNFFFCIPGDLARSLTANFLGESEGAVSREHATETVKEIINMIAGNTFSLYDEGEVFDLDIPEVVRLEGATKPESRIEDELIVAVDTLDNHLAVKMVVHP